MLAGTSFAAAGLLTRYPFVSGQTLRFLLGGIALAAVVAFSGGRWPRPTLKEFGLMALLAATGLVGFNIAVLASLRSVEPAMLGIVVGATPLVVAIAVPLLALRRPSPAMLGAAAIVVLGAGVVIGLGTATPLGLFFALLALLGEVAFTVLAVPLLPRLGAVVVVTYVCLLAAVQLAVLTAFIDVPAGVLRLPTVSEAAALVYLALAVTVAAFLLYYGGLKLLGPERTSLFSGLIPVTAALAAPLIGTGTLGVAQVAGTLLVGLGITLGMAVPSTRTVESPVEPARARR